MYWLFLSVSLPVDSHESITFQLLVEGAVVAKRGEVLWENMGSESRVVFYMYNNALSIWHPANDFMARRNDLPK